MILMQRLVVSSTSAIRAALEKRLEVLAAPEEQLPLFSLAGDDEWADLDSQEQFEVLLRVRLKALKNERAEVKLLLEASTRCDHAGPDAKAESLLEWLYRLQSEEVDPEVKVLVFTEFVPTQDMLRRFLTERGFSVVCLNGSMGMEEREQVQGAFANNARILISTDAGGEGLNLQFCHVVVNYDIPWNPMRLEQRIGRVDRIGQTHTVRAINFVFENSVEHRVREVLEQKLAVIFEEFGIDKTGDVLDSAQAGQIFDDIYVDAILNPATVEDSVDGVITRLQEQIRQARTNAFVLEPNDELDPGETQRLLLHPFPHWVECMTIHYLKARGGCAEKNGQIWDLTWPDGKAYANIVFTAKEAEMVPTARHLTLEDPKVRELAMRLPRFAPGQKVPVVSILGVADEIRGIWSLWQIGIVTVDWNRQNIMPLFLADDGRVFIPTARHIWEQLLGASLRVIGVLDASVSKSIFDQVQKVAEEHGKSVYAALVEENRIRVSREREKADYAFAARRKKTQRIGLLQVRDHRLDVLAPEERNFIAQVDLKAQAYPEMLPLLMIRVEGGR
jgi:hypothetical protein